MPGYVQSLATTGYGYVDSYVELVCNRMPVVGRALQAVEPSVQSAIEVADVYVDSAVSTVERVWERQRLKQLGSPSPVACGGQTLTKSKSVGTGLLHRVDKIDNLRQLKQQSQQQTMHERLSGRRRSLSSSLSSSLWCARGGCTGGTSVSQSSSLTASACGRRGLIVAASSPVVDDDESSDPESDWDCDSDSGASCILDAAPRYRRRLESLELLPRRVSPSRKASQLVHTAALSGLQLVDFVGSLREQFVLFARVVFEVTWDLSGELWRHLIARRSLKASACTKPAIAGPPVPQDKDDKRDNGRAHMRAMPLCRKSTRA